MFFNALEIEKMEKNHYLFYEPGNEIPFAMETYRIKGNFRENLELWDFPLDYQVLYINLFTSCICVVALLHLSIKCELCSLLGECFCVSLPSTHLADLSAEVYYKLLKDTCVACRLLDFNSVVLVSLYQYSLVVVIAKNPMAG